MQSCAVVFDVVAGIAVVVVVSGVELTDRRVADGVGWKFPFFTIGGAGTVVLRAGGKGKGDLSECGLENGYPGEEKEFERRESSPWRMATQERRKSVEEEMVVGIVSVLLVTGLKMNGRMVC